MESCCNLDYIPISQLIKDREIILVKLRDCGYTFGVQTEAYNFFDYLVKKYGNMNFPLLILLDIVVKNISDALVLEGVLHTLSWYDYSEIALYGGLDILYACTESNASLVQEAIIFTIEEWGKPEHIDILELLKLEEHWLVKYRDEVIRKLQ